MNSTKGIWVNVIRYCDGGDIDVIAERISKNFDFCVIKIVDYLTGYNFHPDTKEDLAKALAAKLRAAGVVVYGFVAVLPSSIQRQVDRITERVKEEMVVDGVVVDAEMAWEVEAGKRIYDDEATQLMDGLKKLGMPLGISTFRFPNVHRHFPWGAFHNPADFTMPQVYWAKANNPREQLRMCLDQYESMGVSCPIHPVGPAYTEWGWTPKEGEITAFWNECEKQVLTGVSFWDYTFARKEVRLWKEVKALPKYGIEQPEPPDPPDPPDPGPEPEPNTPRLDMLEAKMGLVKEFMDKQSKMNALQIEYNKVHKHPFDYAVVGHAHLEDMKVLADQLELSIAKLRAEYSKHEHVEAVGGTLGDRMRWLFTGKTTV